MSGDAIRLPSLRERLGETTGVTLVHFTARWCPPCRMQATEARRFAEASGGLVAYLEVDVSADIEGVRDLGIVAVPTLMLLSDGRELCRMTGLRTNSELAALLELSRSSEPPTA